MRFASWLAVGCAPAAPILETTTDGGTWTVRLREAPTGTGEQVLIAEIVPIQGEIAAVVATMPDMGHASGADLSANGDGTFDLGLDLSMAGWWVLDGDVTDGDRTEGFRLELEVP